MSAEPRQSTVEEIKKTGTKNKPDRRVKEISRCRAEANHSEAIAFFEFIAHVRPDDDASRNGAGQLSNDNCSARILKGPYHRFIFLRTIGPACIETQPLSMLTINHAATDRRAICMDVEDRQEDSDATQFCF